MPSVALFEDSFASNLYPITLTRPTFDVKVGARSFFEEYQQEPEYLFTREFLAGLTQERHPACKVNAGSIEQDTVFVNGMLHPHAVDLHRVSSVSHTFAITSGSRLLVGRLGRKAADYVSDCAATGRRINLKRLDADKSTDVGVDEAGGLISHPWDIINALENSLAMQVAGSEAADQVPSGVRLVGGRVSIGPGAEIEEGTVLDASRGGIYIGPQAQIAPCRITGPAYIGGNTRVKQFSLIESSFIGSNCRISGELEHCIFSDCSNKAHDGFLGHSYVGEWVNIGAMTTFSDLKMTYGSIKMDDGRGAKVDTGSNKMGCFVGDMCKTSIGALVYSGRRIGVSSHLHGLVAHDVPGFTIYGAGIGSANAELDLGSALETQKKMMSRRDQKMSRAYEEMIRHVFSMTAADRKKGRVRKAKFSV